MKSILLILSLALVLTITSCGNEQEKSATETESHEDHSHAKPAENELRLNNGQLWEANPETTQGVNNMVQIMNSFEEKENVEAYGELTKELNDVFNLIFKNCTMTGEAHNQLHHFLIPIKNNFKMLASTNLDECKKAYAELNDHLLIYSDYFQ